MKQRIKCLEDIDLFDSKKFKKNETDRSINFFCNNYHVNVSDKLIKQLFSIFKSYKKNVRICLHGNPKDSFHDMIIIEDRNICYHPHKHKNKGETCHIIEGEAAFFVFTEYGKVEACYKLRNDLNKICRVNENIWHLMIPLSEYVIYHESKPGPFLGKLDSIFPDWDPARDNEKDMNLYVKNLINTILYNG